MKLYHTGFQEIREPDVHYGRVNADFGQGFYLTPDPDFARRWAKERKDAEVILNTYELETEGLFIYRLTRSKEWFRYIFSNRAAQPDTIDADAVAGPVANDTIYDTFGIITSGFLAPEEAMRLLMIGPEYTQIALKTENAARHLTWLGAEAIPPAEVRRLREAVAAEEAEYQRLLAEEMEKFDTRLNS